MTSDWPRTAPPSLEQFDSLARRAYEELPHQFRKLCGNVVIHVTEFADDEILADLEIENPFELTGLFEGVDLPHQSTSDIAPLPSHVHLYREPILAEWIERGDVALDALVRHVLVHEIGHHFGLSDDDMHRIEESPDD